MAKEKPTTKLCKYCKTEIPYDAKVCPQCRKKIKGGVHKWILFAFAAMLVIGLIAGGGKTAAPAETSNEPEKTAASGENALQAVNNKSSKKKLEEVSAPEIIEGSFGAKSIDGALKNISGKTLSYVQITFALYDENGAQIGSAVANINNLTKDSVWKYSAVALTMEDWTSFELTEIDSW